MRKNYSQFKSKIKQAKQMAKEDQIKATNLYRQALKINFIQDFDSWNDFYVAKIDFCQALKTIEEYSEGRKQLLGIIQEIKCQSINKKILNKKNIKRIKYLAHHALGKLELAFSNIFDVADQYIKYRTCIDESFKHFKEAFNITIQQLIKGIQEKQKIDKQWSGHYLNVKSHYLQFIFNEGQQFKDKRYFQLIVKQIQKVEQFEENTLSQQGYNHLYRIFYYKSMSLRQLQKFQQSYELLLKDYRFQKQNNQIDYAQKSRSQLFKICLDLNKIQQAKMYINSDKSNKQTDQNILGHVIQRRQKIKKHFSQCKQALSKQGQDFYVQLFDDFDEQQESNMGKHHFRYDLILMNNCILQNQQKWDLSTKRLLKYYLAESHYRLEKYQKAEKYIKEAIQIPSNDQIQNIDFKIEEFKIKIQTCKNNQHVNTIYKSLSEFIQLKIKSQKDEKKRSFLKDHKNILFLNYKEYKKKIKKQQNKVYYLIQSKKQKQLLNMIKAISHTKNSVSFDSNKQNPRQELNLSMLIETQKTREQNLLIKYIKECQQFNIPIRQQIKLSLTNQSAVNPLIKLINLTVQQLLIDYSSIDKATQFGSQKSPSKQLSIIRNINVATPCRNKMLQDQRNQQSFQFTYPSDPQKNEFSFSFKFCQLLLPQKQS